MTSLTFVLVSLLHKSSRLHVPCVCSVTDHRGRLNVMRTSVTHSVSCATLFLHFYVIFDLLNGIHLLISRVRVVLPIKLQHLYSSRNLLLTVSGVLIELRLVLS